MLTASPRKLAHLAMKSAWSIVPRVLTPRIIAYRPGGSGNGMSFSPNVLRGHLQWIKDRGFQGTSVKKAVLKIKGHSIQDANIIAIAIDITETKWIDVIVPILQDLGFSATFFIDVSAHHALAGRLTAIRRAVEEGMEVGSQGSRWIRPLRKRDGATEAFLRELVGGKHKLEEIIGGRVDSYAYPGCGNLRWSRRTRQWIMRLGFECAATSDWNRLSDKTDPYSLPRCEIATTDSLLDFVDKMTGKRDYLKYIPI